MLYERFSFTIFTNIAKEIMFYEPLSFANIHSYNYKADLR